MHVRGICVQCSVYQQLMLIFLKIRSHAQYLASFSNYRCVTRFLEQFLKWLRRKTMICNVEQTTSPDCHLYLCNVNSSCLAKLNTNKIIVETPIWWIFENQGARSIIQPQSRYKLTKMEVQSCKTQKMQETSEYECQINLNTVPAHTKRDSRSK